MLTEQIDISQVLVRSNYY